MPINISSFNFQKVNQVAVDLASRTFQHISLFRIFACAAVIPLLTSIYVSLRPKSVVILHPSPGMSGLINRYIRGLKELRGPYMTATLEKMNPQAAAQIDLSKLYDVHLIVLASRREVVSRLEKKNIEYLLQHNSLNQNEILSMLSDEQWAHVPDDVLERHLEHQPSSDVLNHLRKLTMEQKKKVFTFLSNDRLKWIITTDPQLIQLLNFEQINSVWKIRAINATVSEALISRAVELMRQQPAPKVKNKMLQSLPSSTQCALIQEDDQLLHGLSLSQVCRFMKSEEGQRPPFSEMLYKRFNELFNHSSLPADKRNTFSSLSDSIQCMLIQKDETLLNYLNLDQTIRLMISNSGKQPVISAKLNQRFVDIVNENPEPILNRLRSPATINTFFVMNSTSFIALFPQLLRMKNLFLQWMEYPNFRKLLVNSLSGEQVCEMFLKYEKAQMFAHQLRDEMPVAKFDDANILAAFTLSTTSQSFMCAERSPPFITHTFDESIDINRIKYAAVSLPTLKQYTKLCGLDAVTPFFLSKEQLQSLDFRTIQFFVHESIGTTQVGRRPAHHPLEWIAHLHALSSASKRKMVYDFTAEQVAHLTVLIGNGAFTLPQFTALFSTQMRHPKFQKYIEEFIEWKKHLHFDHDDTVRKRDPYVVLGLEKRTPWEEVRKKYKALCLQYHPDKVPPEELDKAKAKFQEMSDAYSSLENEQKKKQES